MSTVIAIKNGFIKSSLLFFKLWVIRNPKPYALERQGRKEGKGGSREGGPEEGGRRRTERRGGRRGKPSMIHP